MSKTADKLFLFFTQVKQQLAVCRKLAYGVSDTFILYLGLNRILLVQRWNRICWMSSPQKANFIQNTERTRSKMCAWLVCSPFPPFPSSGIAACQVAPGCWNFGSKDAFVGDGRKMLRLFRCVIHSWWAHSETNFASFNSSCI